MPNDFDPFFRDDRRRDCPPCRCDRDHRDDRRDDRRDRRDDRRDRRDDNRDRRNDNWPWR